MITTMTTTMAIVVAVVVIIGVGLMTSFILRSREANGSMRCARQPMLSAHLSRCCQTPSMKVSPHVYVCAEKEMSREREVEGERSREREREVERERGRERGREREVLVRVFAQSV